MKLSKCHLKTQFQIVKTLYGYLCFLDAADPVLTVNLLEELCENTPVNTVIGSFSVIGGTPNYQITILDFQFSAYVSIENGGIITTDGGKVDVTLDRALDREVNIVAKSAKLLIPRLFFLLIIALFLAK